MSIRVSLLLPLGTALCRKLKDETVHLVSIIALVSLSIIIGKLSGSYLY